MKRFVHLVNFVSRRSTFCATGSVVLLLVGCNAVIDRSAPVDDVSADPPNVRPNDRDSRIRTFNSGGGGADSSLPTLPTDARASDAAVPPDETPKQRSPVLLSEIMYHPVLEEAADDNHEFVEIHNRSAAPIALAGWKLAGVIEYTFPAGLMLEAGGYLAVAKNPSALVKDVPRYRLTAAKVVGPYAGALDNGGGTVTLVDGTGGLVESVKYNDRFPWPIGADAFGAGESWFAAGDPRLPLASHRYMGISLQRIDFDAPAAEVGNWAPSPMDGATPGAGNPAGEKPPFVESLSVLTKDGAPLIRASDEAIVSAGLSARGTVQSVDLEWFVDDLSRTDETPYRTPMQPAGDSVYKTVIPARLDPAQKDNAIIRYRVWVDRGAGKQVISPRSSDPHAWHAYFISPILATESRVYQVMIAPRDWTRMWDNIKDGFLDGCTPRPRWNESVSAVFVFEGRVYDVRARYSGSEVHRVHGYPINWRSPGPTGPSPLRAFSWNIKFPGHTPFDGKKAIVLNKMFNNCAGLENFVTARQFEKVGVPTTGVRFARLHVNGGYYNYAMELESVDDNLLEDRLKVQPVGDLFDNDGVSTDQGPFGVGDGRLLAPFCNHSAADRYRATYPRKAPSWKGGANDELVALIQELNQARGAGVPAMRAFFDKNFDQPSFLNYLAITNWDAAWDELLHNHLLYRPAKPGSKWTMLPWDFDVHLGARDWASGPGGHSLPATTSFLIGKAGEDALTNGGSSKWKDAFIQAYGDRLIARMKELGKTVLDPGFIGTFVDDWAKQFSLTDWSQAPFTKVCDPQANATRLRKWVADRQATFLQRYP